MTDTRTLNAPDDDAERREPVTAAHLVIALDCAQPLAPPVRIQLDAVEVEIGRGNRRLWTRDSERLRVDLSDAWMSAVHARMLAGEGSEPAWTICDPGSKNGTFVNGVRVDGRVALSDRDVIEVGNTLLVYRVVTQLGRAGDQVLAGLLAPELPRTLNPAWSTSISTLLRVARSTAPVLLLGETGTGKEVLARAVHAASGRKGAFTALNCGAIATTLIESELFGARKGAFSGATQDRQGLVRAADGGTLFLDEVAELPEASQVALLRVLQEREVMPVGDARAVPVDVRVVAATNADLEARVADQRFRADLWARLAGHVVRVPALRERIEDVGLLVGELLRRLAGARAEAVTLSRGAARALFVYGWPFNVRELEHALEAALAIASDGEIGISHLPEPVRCGASADRPSARPAPLAEESAERDRLVAALEACAGNQTQAARMLGISRATLVNKLDVHRLPRPRKRSR